jgi:hypothetical protein
VLPVDLAQLLVVAPVSPGLAEPGVVRVQLQSPAGLAGGAASSRRGSSSDWPTTPSAAGGAPNASATSARMSVSRAARLIPRSRREIVAWE